MRLLVSRHLENFLALYDARNMHVAAERKGISQPALTKSLRILEDDLGTELFVRTHSGLEPTNAGRALFRHARVIDQEARFAELDVRDVHDTMGGRIRIGVGPVLAVSTFPPILAAFHRRFPKVEISVETGISNHLVDGLMREEFDVVVAALPEMPLPDRFAAYPLYTTGMAVICRRGHPLERQGTIVRDDLDGYGRVGFVEDREFEKKARRVFGAHADQLRPIVQTTSLTVMFGILAATDYYAIVSSMIVPRAEREGLASFSPEDGLWSLEIELMCKASLANTRPVRVLRDALLASPALPGSVHGSTD
ncbi:LysR family transcriptional regulator [Psychromarinibacter sp. C21-152]|uniref:LysR family transcriptional regulator n=1 Tax=Psychromarinibacter sediminicola TaxID=3033385 RepID=A0AAE3NN81_9RHOB|nr:LysR family transcriptional regulator [Psychromarinibacter sediminicola]MDF0599376.1 LysR family transcriptional regulator [Psychromarinibacter sediminicola]